MKNSGLADKVCAMLLPIVIFFGGLYYIDYIGLVRIRDWPTLIIVTIIANSILVGKVFLSACLDKFEMANHCVQLNEMAATAYLSTLAIQLVDPHNVIFQSPELPYPLFPKLPYPYLQTLLFGLMITGIMTAITIVIVLELKKKEPEKHPIILCFTYLISLIGYYLYITLFLLKLNVA